MTKLLSDSVGNLPLILSHNPQENIKARAAFAFLLDRVAQKKEIRNHSLGRRFCGLQKFLKY
ncbi:MAG: hypothetical protein HDT05_05500 [Bacteroidales bacterium]|nr:hypothetical protein [Bacteroidales bacterium]